MLIIKDTDELKRVRASMDGSVGFVPTMGALHPGHLSLIQRAKKENERVIVSIFVNPTQFLEGEDLEKYPKKEEADLKICKHAGVDAVFMPDAAMMYAKDEMSVTAPQVRGYLLEGEKRPGHFDGVLRVVLKLLNLTRPQRAYFGKKDAQQLALIQSMVQDYFLDTTVVPCDIVRDSDGLALSSRNVYLNSKEKTQALSLSRSLRIATKMISSGERNIETIRDAMIDELSKHIKIDYVAIVDRQFQSIEQIIIGDTIILVAGFVGATRLIDNIQV
ncbi:MAG: pantoate--beta-alanine ligase [Sulfurovaceae bacterium]